MIGNLKHQFSEDPRVVQLYHLEKEVTLCFNYFCTFEVLVKTNTVRLDCFCDIDFIQLTLSKSCNLSFLAFLCCSTQFLSQQEVVRNKVCQVIQFLKKCYKSAKYFYVY